MKTVALIILLLGFTMQSQISVGVFADGKLLFIGDSRGNEAGTLDLVVIPKLQNPKGVFVYPYFEYADLQGGEYIRYALGLGYSFKLNNLNIEPSIDYGRILRYGFAYDSFNGVLEINYKIRPNIKVSALNSLTQRNDLYARWGEKTWRYNLYFGIRYYFGKVNKYVSHFRR